MTDIENDYQNSLQQVAKEEGKKVEDLNSLEREWALNRIGLSVLDMQIP